jgi:patatin-like phospholipase/acyl hydrolase
VKVLAIDGGGIRGLIPALVLAEIERRTERRIADLVDTIAGTSTGGILACALGKPDPLPAAEIASLYVEEGPKIFDRSLLKQITSLGGYLDERYSDKGLVSALVRYLGDTPMTAATLPLLLTTYDTEKRAIHLLRSEGEHSGASMVDAAHATSAAPTYFEPVRVSDVASASSYALIDGGVFALNPAMCAFAELAAGGRRDEIDLVVSLGTGSHTRRLPFEDVRGWGQLEWARPLVDVVFDGVAQTVDFELGQILGPERYVRFQTRLTEASDDLDDAGDRNLEALRREGSRLVDARAADLERVAGLLTSADS